MKPAVFLDRDGIVNEVVIRNGKVGSPRTTTEFQIKDEAIALIAALKNSGYLIFVVTNQPDVGDGLCPESEVEGMHQVLMQKLPLDGVAVCYSHDNSDPRRKPNPKMILDFIQAHGIDTAQSYIVGDSDKDIGAGFNAGIRTILLQTDYNTSYHGKADFNCSSLKEVTKILTGTFSDRYLNQTKSIIESLSRTDIESVAHTIAKTRQEGGRLFIIGSGGGAGHASHAACDFRKICNIETYVPTDNISELTARINDEGWATCISEYLKGSRIRKEDCVLVFSVGGGSLDGTISPNLTSAVKLAKEVGASVCGIVGRDGGFTKAMSDACVVIPTIDSRLVTPHTEGFQALVWHLLVSHPCLQVNQTKWESVVGFK